MMEEDHDHEHDKSSLRARRKKSSVSLSCCFNATHHRRNASFDSTTLPPTPVRMSPSTWIKSKTNDFPEIKGKCRNFISRMARHRRHSSAEFSYDPLSYALNFDHEDPSSDDELRAKNFISRLPASPPRMKAMAFDQNRLPRTSTPPESPTLMTMAAGGNHELRRGFEALSASMKRTSVKEPPEMTGEQRRYKEEVSMRKAAVANVRRSL